MAKKSANGQGSIRQRKDGTWEARFTCKDGTRKSVYGKTQKEVREKLTEKTHSIDRGTYNEPSKMTLGEWLDIWERDYLVNVKFTTARSYKATVREHIRPALGKRKLCELTGDDIAAFYRKLAKQGRRVPIYDSNGKTVKDKNGNLKYQLVPLSAKSIKNVHGVLTRCLSDAVMSNKIPSNPAEYSHKLLPRVEKKEMTILTDEQVAQFVKEVAQDEYRRLFEIILFCGLRESEASGLTWDCINFEKGTVTIKQQLVKRPMADGGFCLAETKSSNIRTLHPAPFVMDILKQRKNEQQLDRFKMAEDWVALSYEGAMQNLCFTTTMGERLSPQTIYNHYKKIAHRIGADDTVVHSLRHTHITIRLENGDDIKIVSQDAGHASVAFTLDVYGHVSKKMQEDSAQRMQAYFEKLG